MCTCVRIYIKKCVCVCDATHTQGAKMCGTVFRGTFFKKKKKKVFRDARNPGFSVRVRVLTTAGSAFEFMEIVISLLAWWGQYVPVCSGWHGKWHMYVWPVVPPTLTPPNSPQ